MKRVLSASASVVLLMGLAACGGGGSGGDEPETLTKATVGAALDDICRAVDQRNRQQGVFDNNWPGLEAYNSSSAADRAETIKALEALDADATAQKTIDALVVEQGKAADNLEDLAAAAKAQDDDAYTKGTEESETLFQARVKIYDEVGAKFCADPEASEITIDGSGTKAPADITAAAPGDDALEAASDELQAALEGDDPKALQALVHSDFTRTIEQQEFDYVKSIVGTGEPVAMEAYGPVGTVEYEVDSYYAIVAFVADASDADPVFRYTRVTEHNYGATNPAPKGNDAKDDIAAFTTGTIDGKADAFNGSLYYSGEGSFEVPGDGFDGFGADPEGSSSNFVADIRAAKPEPVLLGQNLAFAFWLLEGQDTDWVVTQVHRPGLDGEYAVDAYWPVPKA